MKIHFLSLTVLLLINFGCSPTTSPPLNSGDFTAQEAAELLESRQDIVVLDIRTPDEFNSGHIEGATMIDFMGDDFDAKIAELDKTTPYLVHCASGGRSGRALAKFNEQGFTAILHLKDGFKGWEAAGMPVAR